MVFQNEGSIISFCEFLQKEWLGSRKHSYAVLGKGKSSSTIWSVTGLREARYRYSWNGKGYTETKSELDDVGERIRKAIKISDNATVRQLSEKIMVWGGVANPHRQRGTFAWLNDNIGSLSGKLEELTERIKDPSDDLSLFQNKFVMNSAMTKIVSLADPEQKLIIYDGRVGTALGFFVARFMEEKLINDQLDQVLRFAVDKTRNQETKVMRRDPSTDRITFPSLFGANKDQLHAQMIRIASEIASRLSNSLSLSPREVEAALFMWGYDVKGIR